MSEPSNSHNGAMLSARATEIETYTGRFVDVANPDPTTLELDDIASGLGLTCRYGGQIRCFYSVAEHSVLVHDLLRHMGAGDELALAGLFHDAAEAYLGDVVAPLKFAQRQREWLARSEGLTDPQHARSGSLDEFRGAYTQLSDRMDEAIAERFGIDLARMNSRELRVADMWALKIEAAALTHTGGAHWRWEGTLPGDGELPARVTWEGGLSPLFASGTWLRLAMDRGVR